MKTDIENDNVRIECAGLELLRIKTRLSQRIGSLLLSGKDYLLFPISSLPLVADIIDVGTANAQVENVLNQYKHHDAARIEVLDIIEKGKQPLLSGHWSEILDIAQAQAVAAMTVNGLLGLCLFDEQGSGKTVMTIAAFDVLKQMDEIDAMIVVCPKSMVSEWPKDINRFLDSAYKIQVAEGDRKEKYEASLNDFDILVTNYEGLEAMVVPLMAIATVKRFLFIVDESYYLKNGQSLRSSLANKLRTKCHKCFVLCGTPAPNSAHDLIHQFDLADLGYTFAGFHKSKDPVEDWDEIATLIETKGAYIRRLKNEILNHVPEKNFHVLRVKLTGKQALMYENARSNLEMELRNLNNETFKKRLATYFQRRAVLLQICTSPNSIDPTLSELPAKYLILDRLLESLISKGRKVVLWSYYKSSLDELYTRYSQYNPVRVDGSIRSSLRKEAVQLFQGDSGTMLFIGNPAAAGAGITLHASYDAVYFSYSNQAAHYLQSLDRIHRRGQVSDEVNYYLLVCENTIEETEIIRLRGKEMRQHNLLGDDIPWPTSLDDALKELGKHE